MFLGAMAGAMIWGGSWSWRVSVLGLIDVALLRVTVLAVRWKLASRYSLIGVMGRNGLRMGGNAHLREAERLTAQRF